VERQTLIGSRSRDREDVTGDAATTVRGKRWVLQQRSNACAVSDMGVREPAAVSNDCRSQEFNQIDLASGILPSSPSFPTTFAWLST
jgi:hypothetical protein